MRGWIELCSDVNWIDYHGMWAKKGHDGAWYVLKWTNLRDAGGDECAEVHGEYECEVKRLVLAEVDIASALRSCGYSATSEGLTVDYSAEVIEPQFAEYAIVEACVSHGFGAPLESFYGSKHPLRLRAEARRYAETCMHDEWLREERLERPVNAIMTSAEDYGAGRLGLFDRNTYDAHVRGRTYHLLGLDRPQLAKAKKRTSNTKKEGTND